MSTDNNKLYIYFIINDDISDSYSYDIPEIIGVWDDKDKLIEFINQYRKDKWYKAIEIKDNYYRDQLTNEAHDYNIYGDRYHPQLCIAEIDKNNAYWFDYKELYEAGTVQERFLEDNDVELWEPSMLEQNQVRREIETKKKHNMDSDKRTRFANLYKEFKEKGELDSVLEGL